MVKNPFFCLILCLISCNILISKNEYGKPRFNKNQFSLRANTGEEVKIRNIIDIDYVYKLEKVTNITFNNELTNFKQIYLKFYKDGRVAIFDIDTIEGVNPQKAIMGIYQFRNNKLYYEYFSYSPQAGYFKTKQELLIKNDKLLEKSEDYISIYGKYIFLSDKEIKPDW